MPADEDISIGLVVVVVPQLSLAGCANEIVGIQINRNAKKKIRIGDKDLIVWVLAYLRIWTINYFYQLEK